MSTQTMGELIKRIGTLTAALEMDRKNNAEDRKQFQEFQAQSQKDFKAFQEQSQRDHKIVVDRLIADNKALNEDRRKEERVGIATGAIVAGTILTVGGIVCILTSAPASTGLIVLTAGSAGTTMAIAVGRFGYKGILRAGSCVSRNFSRCTGCIGNWWRGNKASSTVTPANIPQSGSQNTAGAPNPNANQDSSSTTTQSERKVAADSNSEPRANSANAHAQEEEQEHVIHTRTVITILTGGFDETTNIPQNPSRPGLQGVTSTASATTSNNPVVNAQSGSDRRASLYAADSNHSSNSSNGSGATMRSSNGRQSQSTPPTAADSVTHVLMSSSAQQIAGVGATNQTRRPASAAPQVTASAAVSRTVNDAGAASGPSSSPSSTGSHSTNGNSTSKTAGANAGSADSSATGSSAANNTTGSRAPAKASRIKRPQQGQG